MNKLLSIFLAILFCYANSFAQVVVSAQLDTTAMLLGDQMQLHLMVNHAPEVAVSNPDLSELEKKSGIEVLSVSEWDTLQSGNEYILQKDITFTAWDSGYVWIPKISFSYQQNNDNGIVATNDLPLNVLTPPADTTLAPIKTIIEEEQTIEDFLPFIIGFLVVLFFSIIGYILWKRNQRKELPNIPVIILPAHEVAFKKLKNLKDEKLWQQGHIKKYQSELTFILREYLENRFDIQALESTTDEILQQLQSLEIEEDLKSDLRKILQTSDLVKFAKAIPKVSIHQEVMEKAESFIQNTKLKTQVFGEDEDEKEESILK